jgi:hypothetical protein
VPGGVNLQFLLIFPIEGRDKGIKRAKGKFSFLRLELSLAMTSRFSGGKDGSCHESGGGSGL